MSKLDHRFYSLHEKVVNRESAWYPVTLIWTLYIPYSTCVPMTSIIYLLWEYEGQMGRRIHRKHHFSITFGLQINAPQLLCLTTIKRNNGLFNCFNPFYDYPKCIYLGSSILCVFEISLKTFQTFRSKYSKVMCGGCNINTLTE